MRVVMCVFVASWLVGCVSEPDAVTEVPVPDDPTEPADLTDPIDPPDPDPDPDPVDSRIEKIAFGVTFGVEPDGHTLTPVIEGDGTETPAEMWFELTNISGDLCRVVGDLQGWSLEVLDAEPYPFAVELSDASRVSTNCTDETHDTSWFPSSSAVEHVTQWRFEWGGPLDEGIWDWTDPVDGEQYYSGSKVAGPLMSAPEKTVVYTRAYEVESDMALVQAGGGPVPILAADLVVGPAAPTAAYSFEVPWYVGLTWSD